MKALKKINWLATWLSFALLKKFLAGRINYQENKIWLQPVKKNTVYIFNRVDFILAYCGGKNVLHVGFSDHPFTLKKIHDKTLLHLSLKQSAVKVLGVDNNEGSIRQYVDATNDKNVLWGDVTNKYPENIASSGFDIILFSEVLEHLKCPVQALDVLHDTFTNGTQVLVTVPNYMAIDNMAASFNKTETIHPDHYWYFSPYTLCRLFDDRRFELLQLHFGMYYQRHTKINAVLKRFPFNGDCIIAIFSIKKS
ncbi:MAG: methyltransferase domain-containing protein [Chitinophagaceae bacterium]|nr:methyltransferase domain-containing protein [Chitinophagaceae bacterium]